MGLFRIISLGLQITSLLTYMIGFITLKTVRFKTKGIFRHGMINTVGYVLGFLSLLYMGISAMKLIISRKTPVAVFIHGPFGALTLVLSTLFVTNQWSWKTVKNMRAFVALWLMTFSGGLYIFSVLDKKDRLTNEKH